MDERHLRQGHVPTGGERQRQIGQQGGRLPGLLASANEDRRAPPVLQRRADGPAFDLGAQGGADLVHRQTETSGFQPVHCDRVILGAFVEGRVHVLRAVDTRQDRRQPARELVQLRDVGPEDLDGDVAAHAADHLLDAHVDRLGEAERNSRELRQGLAELLHQRGFIRGLPLVPPV